MTLANTTQLGKGGIGFQGTGKDSTAAAIKELQGLRISLVTGGAANTKFVVPGMTMQDTVLSVLNNNAGTLADVTASATISDTRAVGTVTAAAGGTAGDTVTIAGLVYTLVAANADVAPHDKSKVKIGATAADLATNLHAAVQAREASRDISKVTVTRNAAVLTVTALASGTEGNALTLVEVGNSFTISGATLAGGAATNGVQVSSVTNQLMVYWFKKPA